MKTFNTMYGIGKSRHVVNFHDGVTLYADGSKFLDMRIFGNVKARDAFIKTLLLKGYMRKSDI